MDIDNLRNAYRSSKPSYSKIKTRQCPTCGIACRELKVKKEGPNQGRPFMSCERCQSTGKGFYWLDAGFCACGAPYAQFSVKKESANQGRPFKTCTAGCGGETAFAWLDE